MSFAKKILIVATASVTNGELISSVLQEKYSVSTVFSPPDQAKGEVHFLAVGGQIVKKRRFFRFPFPLNYFHRFESAYFLCPHDEFDVAIGLGFVETFCLSLMRLSGRARAKKMVYYAYDHYPPPKTISWKWLMVKLYAFMDVVNVVVADEVWNLTLPLARLRNCFRKGDKEKQRVVPFGIEINNVANAKQQGGFPHGLKIGFIGQLKEEQGLDIFIMALSSMGSRQFKFEVIGDGSYAPVLRKIVRDTGMEDNFSFHGHLAKQESDEILRSCDVGIALYKQRENGAYKYADQGKVKSYLGLGLPVIANNDISLSEDIEKFGLGFCIGSNEKEIHGLLEKIFLKPEIISSKRENVLAYARSHTYKKIILPEVERLLSA